MTLVDVRCAFKNRVYCGRVNNDHDIIDPYEFLNQCNCTMMSKIDNLFLSNKSAVKVNFDLVCEYVIKKGRAETVSSFNLSTKMAPLLLSEDFNTWYLENMVKPIRKKMDEFQERESGKALRRILCLQVIQLYFFIFNHRLTITFMIQMNIGKFNPTNGGSSYIKLPASIEHRKACINLKNADEKCFVWSLLSAIFPVDKHVDRVSKYPQNHEEHFNLSGINFPTPLSDIPKFEKNNDISINVYGIEPKKLQHNMYDVIGPLHSTNQKKDRHINLLYFEDGDRSHYCWIKNLSRLLYSQLSKRKEKKWVCELCLQYFGKKILLTRHEDYCKLFDPVRIDLPDEDHKWLEFKNYMNKERHPFVVYADFEALIKPIDTCQPDPTTSYTNAYQNHVPCAVAYQMVCSYDDSLSFYKFYTGEDAAKWFMEGMKNVAHIINQINKNIKPMTMTDDDNKHFNDAVNCHICNKPLYKDKVRDHCHLSGKFRGAAHNRCNLNYTIPSYIPVFFHNLSGYDSHLFVKELGADEETIKIIPSNEERYISFSKKVNNTELRFLDSFR